MAIACPPTYVHAAEHSLAEVRASYTEMPGLCLTLHQARRLFGLDDSTTTRVLHALVASGFLAVTRTGMYVRADVR